MIPKLILPLLLLTAALALQQPQPIPPTDDEDHEGQPAFCVNSGTEFVHNCECMPQMDSEECGDPKAGGGENKHCAVYCRRSACRCQKRCSTE